MASEPKGSEKVILFGKDSIVGKAPDTVDREHKQFKKRISSILKGRENLASSKKELLQRIQDAGNEDLAARDLGARAVKQFEDASETQNLLGEERSHGVGAVNAGLQRSLFAVSRFAAAYSSILDAVSSASGPYAEIGWQTMSILLIVVVNKTKNEKNLGDHMSQIEKMLPRLGQWKEIYQHRDIGKHMQKLVGDIYLRVIEFSRAVAEYCCHFWTKRLWPAISAAKLEFDETAKLIYKLLAEVNATASIGLHTRALNIENEIGLLVRKADEAEARAKKAEEDHSKLLEDNKALRARLDKQASQEDGRRFHVLQQLLNVTLDHPGLSLSVTKSSLRSEFPDADEYNPHDPYSTYEQMTPAKILSHPTYQAWANASYSSLLFINGHTNREGREARGLNSSWLSPAAIHISEFHAGSSDAAQGKVSFFSCRPDRDHLKARADEVLAATALKLVSMNKEILRDRLGDFERTLRAHPSIPHSHSYPLLQTPPLPSYSNGVPSRPPSPLMYYDAWSPNVSQHSLMGDRYGHMPTPAMQPTFQQLTDLILDILNELAGAEDDSQKTSMYIVLDRLDSADDVRIHEIMNELARMVGKSQCCVKIAVVVEESQMEGTWRVQDVPSYLASPNRLFDLHMNQRQLSEETEKRPRIWSGFENPLLSR